MPPYLSATEIAYAMVGIMQGVLALVWLAGSWMAGDMQRAARHWSAFAALSAASFAALTLALRGRTPEEAEALRAVGNLCGIAAFIALQRGIWLFVGAPLRWRAHLAVAGVAFVVAILGLSPARGALRVGVTSTLFATLAAGMALDLGRYARDALGLRRPWLLAAPLVAASAGFAFRALLATLRPATVAAQMTTDSSLNVGSALGYLVIALTFHASLMALVVGRLLADLRHRSRHDGLTGLLNRRAVEEALQNQVQRSRRTGESFTVLMLDLDHFKAINDRHGHAAGDRALKHAAAALRGGIREVDALGRFGGEEFLVLMPGASLEASLAVAERLRAGLHGNPLLLAGEPVGLSVSVGIAQWQVADEDASRVLVRADAALYEAKLRGRNCVVTEAAGTLAEERPVGPASSLQGAAWRSGSG